MKKPTFSPETARAKAAYYETQLANAAAQGIPLNPRKKGRLLRGKSRWLAIGAEAAK